MRTVTGILLQQNIPNPFKDATMISYQIIHSGNVRLKVYNIMWSGIDDQGRQVASRVYSCRLETEDQSSIKKKPYWGREMKRVRLFAFFRYPLPVIRRQLSALSNSHLFVQTCRGGLSNAVSIAVLWGENVFLQVSSIFGPEQMTWPLWKWRSPTCGNQIL